LGVDADSPAEVVDKGAMTMPIRSVPLAHAELAAAITGGVFPRERQWIDFKRRLYPEAGAPPGGAAREKVSEELARDMASMAEAGGFLVFGVKEDKAQHTFEVDEMDLPVGLHETVDAVARNRITPPLTVSPVLVPNPAVRTKGFLVVEIPESPESPHMTDYTYWGRSETGRIRLSDERVERLMLARGRLEDQLAEHMASTADADPVSAGDRRETHFYFTAVPTRRWPDMLARYTVGDEAQMRLAGLVHRLAEETRRADRTGRSIAYSRVGGYRRSQRVEGLWMNSWDGAAVEGRGRAVGVDDGGTVRYISLATTGRWTADPSPSFVREWDLLFQAGDMIRLVAVLAAEIGYRGTWALGVEADRLRGLESGITDVSRIERSAANGGYDADGYSRSTRASFLELCDRPYEVVSRLMRPLLRGLGTEYLLSAPPFGASGE
jgi:hypothetical protein